MRTELLNYSWPRRDVLRSYFGCFFNTTLNIRVTEDRVTASTSSTKYDKLGKQTAGNHSTEALELLLHGAGC